MTHESLITSTENFVKKTLAGAESGHDWWHILRVWNNAKLIAQTEDVNMTIVELAALLHDIADSKFNNGDEEIGPQTAAKFLREIGADETVIEQVALIIKHLSFKASFDGQTY